MNREREELEGISQDLREVNRWLNWLWILAIAASMSVGFLVINLIWRSFAMTSRRNYWGWGFFGLCLLLGVGCAPEEEPVQILAPETTAPRDGDADGYSVDLDCDDGAATIYPGAPELCNGKDDDCDGHLDEDLPGIGIWPDADLDGWGADDSELREWLCEGAECPEGYRENHQDCDDANAGINPDALEVPGNTVDEDCNGTLL